MNKRLVAVVHYEKPLESVRRAIELSRGMDNIPANSKVFVKPNICFWRCGTIFPKWGVITTSRVIEDTVILLKERGIEDITIGEGIVLTKQGDNKTPADAFESLGYNVLSRQYGVKVINVHKRPVEKVDLGSGIELNFNTDILHSDFVVNIPVLKTHLQTVVSLGIKNLKGAIDIESRKKCHSADAEKNLNFIIARLANILPQSLTIIDGIYSNEIGPSFEGNIRRSNILIASSDILSADFTGAKILGYEPAQVPHLMHAAQDCNRPLDLSDVEIAGEDINSVSSFHEYAFPYNEDGTLPESLKKIGVKGLTCPKYDLSVCTYCTTVLPMLHHALAHAWKGEPWQDIEILTGKIMKPAPGKKKTILIGKCIYQANKEDPDINEMIAVKGCPPQPQNIIKALRQADIEVNPFIFEILNNSIVLLMQKYAGRPEFDESHFKIHLPKLV